MTKLAKAALLSATAILGFSAQQVRGAASPEVVDVPFAQFENKKSETGPDGNNRFIWDYFSTSAAPAYLGSVLWILDPTGKLIATGNVQIPASVGFGNATFLGSHIALHVFADNNTTLAFAFLGKGFVQSFATWTFNAQGTLIAAAGPFSFSGLGIQNIEFQGQFLVVRWLPSTQLTGLPGPAISPGQGPSSVWVLDEFGTIVSAAGPFGPFALVELGSITLPPNNSGPPNQLWHWVLEAQGPGTSRLFGVNTWTINPSGVVITSTNFGPF